LGPYLSTKLEEKINRKKWSVGKISRKKNSKRHGGEKKTGSNQYGRHAVYHKRECPASGYSAHIGRYAGQSRGSRSKHKPKVYNRTSGLEKPKCGN